MSITLVKNDCLQYMKTLPDKSVDCFICDLPYGCLSTSFRGRGDMPRYINGKKQDTTINTESCSWDIKLDLDAFWEQIKRLRKDDHSPCLMFCTTKFGYDLIKSNEKEFRYDLVWDKQRGVSFLSANKMPMRSHEMIYVFAKSGAYYNRVDVKGDYLPTSQHNGASKQYGAQRSFKPYVRKAGKEINAQYNATRTPETVNGSGRRCVLSVLQNPTSSTRGGHPTEKPEALYKFLIERYCPPGGTILDPTAGSFNSCFAGMELDRHCIGIEKDNKFYEKACKRVDENEELF